MSGFSSIYTSLTGLLSYSDALNTISDNIANLNTPGFKGNDVLFRDLAPSNPEFQNGDGRPDSFLSGNGVTFSGTRRSFAQGPFEQTNGSTDLAINGNGFFVLNHNGKQVFSRAGQFTFDSQGFLVDTVTQARVQAIDSSGNISDLKVEKDQVKPAVTSTEIKFTGNLDTGSTTPISTTVSNVIDATGKPRKLTLQFTKGTATSGTSWSVVVTDDSGKTLLSNGQIQFDGTGFPTAGANTLKITLGGADITLNFGDPGTQNGVTAFSSGGTGQVTGTPDGSTAGTLTQITFNQQGVVQLTFSNGVTASGQQIALANFSDPSALTSVGSAQFEANTAQPGATPQFGRAGDGAFGSFQLGEIELSNVNLSQEFSTIVVLQNGYQGSSQILNVSNQLLDDLYKSLGNQG
jgi:flagellar hook protein FlgE